MYVELYFKMPKSSLNSIYNIVARKVSGQITERENKLFDKWINSSEEAKETYNDLEKIWSNRYFSEEDVELVSQREANEKIWQSTFEKSEGKNYNNRSVSIFVKWAAIFAFFLSLAFYVYYTVNEKIDIAEAITIINKQTLPGQKSTIPLPDGSIVWLNSGSTISYQSDFNDSIRIIELHGHAYFEVFVDRTKPFIVKCGDLEVKALGTSFDVNGYNGASIQVSLISGSVQLSTPANIENNSFILLPGEYSILDANNQFTEKGKFNSSEVLAWKEGRLIFKNATLDEIIPKLEMWYGVKIDNQTTHLVNKHFNSTFEKENLDNILHNMGLSMGFTHDIHENTVSLKNKLPM